MRLYRQRVMRINALFVIFCSLVAGLSSTALANADLQAKQKAAAEAAGEYVKGAYALTKQIIDDFKDMEAKRPGADTRLANAKGRVVDLTKLDTDLKDTINKLLLAMASGSPAYKWANEVRAGIVKTYKETASTNIVQTDPVADIKEHQDGFYVEDLDPYSIQLVHFNTYRGWTGAPMALFRVLAVNVRLQLANLMNNDILAVSSEKPHLPYAEYFATFQRLVYSVYVVRTFFPLVPDPHFGQFSAAGKDDDVGNGISKRVSDPLEEYFGMTQPLTDDGKKVVRDTLKEISYSVEQFESFRRRFFPSLENSVALDHLGNAIASVRGLAACLGIIKGVSDFTGPACDFSAFKKSLQAYKGFYNQIEDLGVLWMFVGYIREFFEGKLGEGDAGFRELQKRLEAIPASSRVNPGVKEKWPNVVRFLLAPEPIEGYPKGAKTLRQLLEMENPKPYDIFRLLRLVFHGAGIGVTRFTEPYRTWLNPTEEPKEGKDVGPVVEAGVRPDMLPNVVAVQGLLEELGNNVEGKLKTAVVGNSTEENRLQVLTEKISYLNASRGSCEMYLPKSDNDQKEKDRRAAPWVIYSKGYNLKPAQGDERTPLDPRITGSANGFQRLVWQHKAGLANSVTIQESLRFPKEQLAAIAVSVGMRLAIANAVQVDMLLNKGKASGTKPEDLKIDPKVAKVVDDFSATFDFPSLQLVMEKSRLAFETMIRTYAARANLLLTAEEALKKERDSGEFDKMTDAAVQQLLEKRIEEAYQKDYEKIVEHFRNAHAQQMLVAAKTLQKLHEIRDHLKAGKAPPGAPSVGETVAAQLNMPGFEAHLGEKGTPWAKQNRDQMNAQINVLRAGIRRDYIPWKIEQELRKKYPDWSITDIRAERDRIKEDQIKKRNLTNEEWIEAFKMFGARWGGSDFHHRMWNQDDDPKKKLDKQIHVEAVEHAEEIFRRIAPDLDQAIAQIQYQFVSLKLKNKSDEEYFKVYNGSEDTYREVMQAFLDNAITQVNKFSALGRTQKHAEDQVKEILDKVVPNLPFMDIVLRTFPQFKRALCVEQEDRRIAERNVDIALTSVEVVSTVAACVPVLAPVAGVVYIGTLATALVVHSLRAWERAKELEDAKLTDIATGPQVDFSHSLINEEYYGEMESQWQSAMIMVGVDVAFAGLMGAPKIGKALRTAISQGAKGLRSFSSARLLAWYAQMTRKNFWNVLKFWSVKGAAARFRLNPFTHLGLTWPWRQPTLWARLYPHFSLKSGMSWWRRILGVPWNVTMWGKDLLVQFPWSILGQQWARTWAATGVQLGLGASAAVSIYHMCSKMAENEYAGRIITAMAKHPGAYDDLEKDMAEGKISQEELFMIVDLDTRLSEDVNPRQQYADIANKMEEEVSRAQADGKARDEVAIRNMWNNLEDVGKKIRERRAELAKKGTDFRNPEYLLWDRMNRDYDQVLGRVMKHRPKN